MLCGKLPEAAAKLAKRRSYQTEVEVGKKSVAVDIPVTEVQVRILRKLDRSTTSTESEVSEEVPD